MALAEATVFAVIWAIVTAIAEIVFRRIKDHSMYYTISSQGHIALSAFNFLSSWLIPIFTFMAVMVIFALVRFRAPDNTPRPSPVQTLRNKWYILLWVGVSFALNIMFWLHPTAVDLETMFANWKQQQNQHPLIVNVTARQWEWIFSYPQYGITQAVNAQGLDELELPVGRPVEFFLRSKDPFHSYDIYADVIHSFWIPAFGIKEDVIPGETRTEFLVPDHVANYETSPLVRVQCAEVCGPGHPYMEAPLSIVTAKQFSQWIAHQKSLQAQGA
ncbi:MAG: cytochrome C oxidase subunit II [Sulfobacillus benefaciens]|uniref:cytochrome-c oxidase n=1 Tax=Sulfobacillus benefaciens TaxID=453960 RepID=A0A2T2X7Q0_9FIRM|nr:MAG: cytochrome C oxidase subunit II [Sulfobacillus benefaciens]